MSKITKMPFFG